jgi:signal transduction histidine kinase
MPEDKPVNVMPEHSNASDQHEFSSIFDILDDAVIIVNRDGIYNYLNSAAVRILGFNPINRDLNGVFRLLNVRFSDGAAMSFGDNPLSRALHGEIVNAMRILFTDVDGKIHNVSACASPVYQKGIISGAVLVLHDLNESFRLLDENKNQSKLLEQVILNVPVGIAIYQGPDIGFTITNSTFIHLTYTKDASDPHSDAEIWPDIIDQLLPFIDQVFNTGETYRGTDMPFQIRREQAMESAYFSFVLTPQFTATGKTDSVLVVIQETTAQVAIRIELADEQARLKAIINNAPEAILVADHQGRIIMANPVAEQLLEQSIPYYASYSSHIALGICFPDGTPYDPRQLPLTRSALDGEICSNLEISFLLQDGCFRPILINTAPIYNRSGSITGAIGIFQDITRRKEAEQERRRSAAHMEVHRYLNEHREKERLEIAHEIHDGPLQELIALSYQLDDILGNTTNTAVREKLESMKASVQKQVHELRFFCNELRPPALAPFGLEKAIRSSAETVKQLHPDLLIKLDLMHDGKLFSENLRMALFRIYKEMLNNTIRHAQAHQIEIRFSFDDHLVHLELQDDGRGFEVPDDWLKLARQGHLGLVGIQERVESIGGSVEFISSAGKGTRVKTSVPHEPSKSD